MASSLLIRTGITPVEWRKIRRLAAAQDISAKKLVTDAIREALLSKGA